MFKNKLDLVKVLKVATAILKFLIALIVFIEKLQGYLHVVPHYFINELCDLNGNVETQI